MKFVQYNYGIKKFFFFSKKWEYYQLNVPNLHLHNVQQKTSNDLFSGLMKDDKKKWYFGQVLYFAWKWSIYKLEYQAVNFRLLSLNKYPSFHHCSSELQIDSSTSNRNISLLFHIYGFTRCVILNIYVNI